MTSAPRVRARRHVAIVGALVLAMAVPALGQWVVFDPSNYQEALQQFTQLERQYTQLTQTYQLLKLQSTALNGNLTFRYRSVATPWAMLTAPDTYGTTSPWITSANTGQRSDLGYQRLAPSMQAYGPALAHMPADEATRATAAYGGIQLADGLTMSGLATAGQLRAHAAAVETALSRLEDDSFSTDPSLNTEVAVLNKINAAVVTAARLTKDTNQILLALLDQQLVGATRQRQSDATAVNAHIAFELQAANLLHQSNGGMTDTLASFRLP